VSNGFFRKNEFRYDAERDAFICPAGQVLSTRYESKLRELTKIDYSNRAACLVCAIKSLPPRTIARSRVWKTRRYSTAWRRD
jgi:hypothetical protein